MSACRLYIADVADDRANTRQYGKSLISRTGTAIQEEGNPMKTVAIVACSNAQKEEYRSQNEELARYLEETGHKVLWSNDIYEKNAAFSGTGAERAAELMRFFNDPEVEEIYDISGGDLANQVLDGLDYAAIRRSRAVFWGYSDLTTVINAIYAQTGKSSVLYQVKNMVWGEVKRCSGGDLRTVRRCLTRRFALCRGRRWKALLSAGISAAF